MKKNIKKPQVLFETSWEICNKVGGIHTVISTKAESLLDQSDFKYILIGPDVWRNESQNPEFEPDPELFKEWREQFQNKAFSVKTGRWNIPGKPIVLLIDFYPLINRKDEVFSKYWENYKLDSISGQWDYIEPALFGTAAGEVIQDLCLFYEEFQQGAVAHFHEWMTGTGILYLKKNAPQIGTVFTTHATSLGRSLAGNGKALYSKLLEFAPLRSAMELGVTSKQSLESLSALNADAFSTVSDITALECSHFLGKQPDLVTPNGFEDSFVPENKVFLQKRKLARKKLLQVASAMGNSISEDALLVATSGRYEFKNKGIDLFLEALKKIEDENPKKDVLAFILVPAGISGPRLELLNQGSPGENEDDDKLRYITHYLTDPGNDPVLNYCRNIGLSVNKDSKVKILFVPSYLNGDDGLFNIPYYELLIGFDLTVFPSYYEPWGYTPLESLAFHIPTITSSLAGFGKWVNDLIADQGNGIKVLERTDTNFDEATEELAREILNYVSLSDKEMEVARNKAFEISRTALWKKLVNKYFEIYDIALGRSRERYEDFDWPQPGEISYIPPAPSRMNKPTWRKLFVESNVPENISFLKDLSKNLWWSWNTRAIKLWEQVDSGLWNECGQNPIELLEKVNYKRLLVLSKDNDFLMSLKEVEKEFLSYMNKAEKKGPQIAYFSMEYGLHDSLKIFSGGLGILAGDFLKEASDSNVSIVAVGLLYRFGYFKQVLTLNGEQTVVYKPEQFSKIPAFPVLDKNANWLTISIALPGRNLTAYLWKVQVGRVSLYLLDTDHQDNQPQDRSISHNLYGGDLENRFKQETLLGIGGIRALKKLNIQPDIYHSNEGHSAFIGLERLWNLIREKNLNFNEALEVVRSSTLFTTHTPVPAGHDMFPEGLLRTYMGHYPERLGISWESLLSMGRAANAKPTDKFNMSFLAANMSLFTNGVSKLHGQVSRELFMDLWPGYLINESPIGYVTNGVHYKTWTAPEWIELYERILKKPWGNGHAPKSEWSKILEVKDQEIWEIKQGLKQRMIENLKNRLKEAWTRRNENPRFIMEISERLQSKALTIGFARRFATYKRAHLLFKNLDRLSQIVNHPDHPVQFIFAGKAHPNDKAGQDMIKEIVEISKKPEFIGKIIFLQNYDIALARQLVQGVDVWLNTPTRPLEASGTSGEKAIMNGTLHFSVLDGWWVEGFKPGAGWGIAEKRTYENQDFQDELDAETLYQVLESEIIPGYYNRDKSGLPRLWVSFIKKTMSEIAPRFTTNRMMGDYLDRYYHKLEEHAKEFSKNQYNNARLLAKWKNQIRQQWEQIEVLSIKLPGEGKNEYLSGQEYSGKLVINLKDIDPKDIILELIISKGTAENAELVHKQNFILKKVEDGLAYYEIKITPTYSGGFNFGFRLAPSHSLLQHNQDFPINSWI